VDTLSESLTVTVGTVNDQPVRTAGTVADLAVLEDSGTTSLGLGGLTYGVGGGADEVSQTLTYTAWARSFWPTARRPSRPVRRTRWPNCGGCSSKRPPMPPAARPRLAGRSPT